MKEEKEQKYELEKPFHTLQLYFIIFLKYYEEEAQRTE